MTIGGSRAATRVRGTKGGAAGRGGAETERADQLIGLDEQRQDGACRLADRIGFGIVVVVVTPTVW